MINKKFWKNKKILLTGHSGFKGTWFTYLLIEMGSKVLGISDKKNLKAFKSLNKKKFQEKIFDINDLKNLNKTVQKFKPDIIFHFAAQSIVSESYVDPIKTFNSNINGTLNVLQVSRYSQNLKSIIIITSDKCYDVSIAKKYLENDKLGGIDPYSASKASAEILSNSMYKSFFMSLNKGVSTARAGNIIGGGDFSKDRIVPDTIKALINKKTLILKNPISTRPWQYVLDVLIGYMLLAEKNYKNPKKFSGAWNFGPKTANHVNVISLVKLIENQWGNKLKIKFKKKKIVETKYLKINSSKSNKKLKWKQYHNISETVFNTVEWYKKKIEEKDSDENLYLFYIKKFLKKIF